MSSGDLGNRSDDAQTSRSTRHGVRPLLISGLTVVIIGAVLIAIWAVWFYVLMAKIEGSFLINDEPAREMEIHLLDADTEKELRLATSREDGSYSLFGLKPGTYTLHASSYLPPSATCVSLSSEFDFEITNPSSDSYLIYVLVRAKDLCITPGLGKSLDLDIILACR
jgi:hypothetical protein